jgi:hypothetical protein
MNFIYEYYQLIPIIEYRKYFKNLYFLSNNFLLIYSGILGFTNAKPSVFVDQFDQLPTGDPMALYDRKEFWILNDNAFDEKLAELDEYRILFDKSGDILMWRNNESKQPTRTCADNTQQFYPFFFLNGRITALALMGIVSTTRIAQTDTNNAQKSPDDDADLCKICVDARANCVLIPCGHIFFCSACKDDFERTSAKKCPTCRSPYESAIEFEVD